jgi:hypothetical protein
MMLFSGLGLLYKYHVKMGKTAQFLLPCLKKARKGNKTTILLQRRHSHKQITIQYYYAVILVRQAGWTWTPFENLSNRRIHRQYRKSVVLNLFFEIEVNAILVLLVVAYCLGTKSSPVVLKRNSCV